MRDNERPIFARLTSSSYDPDRLDTAIDRFHSSTMPALRRKPGFLGAATLLNRDHNRVMAITLWGTDSRLDPLEIDPETMEDVLTVSRNWTSPLVRETYSVYVFEVDGDRRLIPGTAHARLTSMRVNPIHWDAIVAAGHDAARALSREQSGFVGAIGLGDRVIGKATFIELWENRPALRTSESTAYRQERAARAVRMLVGLPQHSNFQIEQCEFGAPRPTSGDCDRLTPGVE